MATVKLITGRIVENVRLTDIEHVGDEGSRTAIAHIDGKTYPVYNSIANGITDLWVEQMTYETFKMLEGNAGFVEGSIVREEGNTRDKMGRMHPEVLDLLSQLQAQYDNIGKGAQFRGVCQC